MDKELFCISKMIISQFLFVCLFQGYIPDPFHLREFVILPPPGNERLHCTMLRHGDENSGGSYTLYLEYLGGLIPLLKGKRASKIRPEFVIYDPKIKVSRAATCRFKYSIHAQLNPLIFKPSNAEATFVQSTRIQRFLKTKPCHVSIYRKALAKYSQMSTHVPGFQSFFSVLHHFVLAKLATTSIKVKSFSRNCCLDI